MTRFGGVKAAILCGIVLWGLQGTALSQRIELDLRQEALDRALLDLGEKGGVDLVFAHRYTDGVQTTCRIQSATVEEALACILAGTSLRAERVRERQWIVLPVPAVARPTESTRGEAAPSASLRGTIIDAVSGEVLVGANVYLENRGVGGTTNQAGRFLVTGVSVGSHPTRLSYVGYESLMVELSTGEAPVLALNPVSLAAGEIVVEGNRTSSSAASPIPGRVAVLDHRKGVNPELIAEDDLFQTLQWLPAVRQSGEAGGDLVVRGSGPDQNLHILDGAPLYHPWHTMGQFSTLQTEALKDAQLYAGSIPAEFGGRLSSVLDTRLKDGRGVDPRLLVSVGSMATQFVAEAPLSDQFSFMVAGRRSFADGLLNGSGLGTPERITLQNSVYSDLNAKVTYRPVRGHEVRFSYFQGSDQLPMDASGESVRSIGWNRYITAIGEASSEPYRWKSRLAGMQYAWLRGTRLLVTAGAFWSTFESREGESAGTSMQTASLSDVGLKLDGDYFAGRRHSVRAGIHLTMHDFAGGAGSIRSSLRGLVDAEARSPMQTWEAVAYLQDTWSPSRRLQIQPGLRVSGFGTTHGIDVLPRVSARWTLHPEYFVLKAGFSRQVQYIHQVRDRFADTYGLSASRWVPASEEGLQPAAGRQMGLGVESRPFSGVELSAEVYHRTFSGVLIPTLYAFSAASADPRTSVLEFYHTGGQQAFGFEFFGSLRRDRWRTWTSYAYGHSEEQGWTSSSHPVFISGRFDVPHVGRAGVSLNHRSFAASLVGEIRSGYPVSIASPPAGYTPAPTASEGISDALRPLPTYARLDARVGYQTGLLGMRWNVQMDVFNVTHRKNIIGHIYAVDGTATRRSDLYGLPRLPLFKVRVEF